MTNVPLEDRRERLLDAALQVATAEGLSKLTTRRITDQAGSSAASFHYAFDDKTTLVRQLIRRLISETATGLAATPPPDLPLGDLVECVLRRAWDTAASELNTQLAQFELLLDARRNGDPDQLMRWAYQQYAGVFEELYARAADMDQRSADVNLLGQMTLLLMDGLLLSRLADADSEAAEKRLAAACRALRALT